LGAVPVHLQELSARSLSYRYPNAIRLAVSDVSLRWCAGERIGLVGHSGSGKSTLGQLLKGLIEPESGEILLLKYSGIPQQASVGELIGNIGWASAHPESQIFASTVRDEVAFAPRNQGLNAAEVEARVKWSLETMDIAPSEFLERYPLSLSGGEKRRLALASIVAMRGQFYIFDEPTAGLDEPGINTCLAMLNRLRDSGCGVLWITHDWSLLKGRIDRLWWMENGRIIMDQPSENIDWSEVSDWLMKPPNRPDINQNNI
jgi:energy-coupling factor transporter ATP-binding protein EcfA2